MAARNGSKRGAVKVLEHPIRPKIYKVAWMPLDERRVLFARSRKEEKIFYCAGGKREPGENDINALLREVREECGGVDLIPPSIVHVKTFDGPAHGGGEMRMVCYNADYEGRLKPSGEVVELAWFTTADKHRTTPMGVTILEWYHEQGLID